MTRAPTDGVLGRLVAAIDCHDRLAIAVTRCRFDDARNVAVALRPGAADDVHATGPAVPAARAGAWRRTRRGTAGRWSCSMPASSPTRATAPIPSTAATTASRIYERIREPDDAPSPPAPTATTSATTYRPARRGGARRRPPLRRRGDREAGGLRARAPGWGSPTWQRLPAQPCLASRVETGIAIAAADLAFIDAVESGRGENWARRGGPLPGDTRPSRSSWRTPDAPAAGAARAIGADACRAAGRDCRRAAYRRAPPSCTPRRWLSSS